jgi:dTDP-4-dehydrorhamnose reductase
MKVAVIGSKGQLGSDLITTLDGSIPLSHEEIDVTEYKSCEILKKIRPDVTINTAAYHKTDECEDNPGKSFLVNSIGAKNIADICNEIGSVNVYISTDYVFDGNRGNYTEDDIPNPINWYGVSKYAGEIITRTCSPRHYIFRVSSLFGQKGAGNKGGNFIETMINLSKSRDEVTVVNDIFMSPTYTSDAAALINKVISYELPFGIYHVNNTGCCSWYEFAQNIYSALSIRTRVTPILSSQYPARAKRPPNSGLINRKITLYNIRPRRWQEGLLDYLKRKGRIQY